jgi:hypothetical protein
LAGLGLETAPLNSIGLAMGLRVFFSVVVSCLEFWSLRFDIYLLFGAWNLGFIGISA